MKYLIKIIFSIFLLFPSISLADWEKFFRADDGSESYFRTDLIKFADGYYYAWVLGTNYEPEYIEGNYHRSMTIHIKIDCSVNRWGILSVNAYSKLMGLGDRLMSVDVEPAEFVWEYTEPDTMAYSLLKKIC